MLSCPAGALRPDLPFVAGFPGCPAGKGDPLERVDFGGLERFFFRGCRA